MWLSRREDISNKLDKSSSCSGFVTEYFHCSKAPKFVALPPFESGDPYMENPERNGSSGMRGGGQGRGLPGRVGQVGGVPQGMDRPMDADGRDMGQGGNFSGRDAAVGMGGRGEGMHGRAGGDMSGQTDGMRVGYGDRRMSWAADGGGNGGKRGLGWWCI